MDCIPGQRGFKLVSFEKLGLNIHPVKLGGPSNPLEAGSGQTNHGLFIAHFYCKMGPILVISGLSPTRIVGAVVNEDQKTLRAH